MAKKTTVDPTFVPESAEAEETLGGEYQPDELSAGISSDWNVESEYKPAPLIPNGWFSANITKANIDAEKQCIVITHTLVDNGGVMSDGETEIDGGTIDQRIWLPRPGDENELTKDGKQTKRQSKINMLKDAGVKLKLDFDPLPIARAIRNSDWIGLATKVKIKASEYEGRVRNEVADAKAA